jgi:hypothetical protein
VEHAFRHAGGDELLNGGDDRGGTPGWPTPIRFSRCSEPEPLMLNFSASAPVGTFHLHSGGGMLWLGFLPEIAGEQRKPFPGSTG